MFLIFLVYYGKVYFFEKKKKKKNWNTKSDIVSLPSLTSIYQFLKTKILKQKT